MSTPSSAFGTPHPAALVTGSGAPRIGNCVAHTLAARGYRVALHAHHSLEQARAAAEELRSAGTEAIALGADLTQEEDVDRLIDQAAAHFGRLDALVNCAAIWQSQPLEDVRAEDLDRHWRTNALATFLCARRAGLVMAAQPTGGAIVNLGDWATVRPYLHYAAYFPSKGAVEAMTRDLAVELAARNPRVRVNAVLPGPVMLPAEMPLEEKTLAIQATLVKREGSPQHVADAVAFLLENDFITGVLLPVDGGRSIYAP